MRTRDKIYKAGKIEKRMIDNFGARRNSSIYEEDIGKWMIYSTQNRTYAGKIERIVNGEYIIQNPRHLTSHKGGIMQEMIITGLPVRIRTADITASEQLSEEEIIGFCEYHNNKRKKEAEKENSKKPNN